MVVGENDLDRNPSLLPVACSFGVTASAMELSARLSLGGSYATVGSLAFPSTLNVLFFTSFFLALGVVLRLATGSSCNQRYVVLWWAGVMAISLGASNGLTHLDRLWHTPGDFLARAGVTATVSALAAYGLYGLSGQRRFAARVLAATVAAGPLIAWTLLLSVWVHKHQLGAFFSLPSLTFSLCALGLVLLFLSLAVLTYAWNITHSTVTVLIAVVALTPLFTLVSKVDSVPPRQRPDIPFVVLITIDTLRADALRCYDASANPTPTLDALASDGVLFERAYSPTPWTYPSMVSLHTGLDPFVHGCTKGDVQVPDQVKTLAERMNQRGYRTAAMGYNPYLTASSGLDQGFETYDMYPKAQKVFRSMGGELVKGWFSDVSERESREHLTDRATNWIHHHQDEPFFLWLHYIDPHLPYTPSSPHRPTGSPPLGMGQNFGALQSIRQGTRALNNEERAWVESLYKGEVQEVDAVVGRIVEALRQGNIYDRTLIIVTSDHGEEFWDHGGFEHGHTLYNELLHVPLIFRGPGVKPGVVVPHPVPIYGVLSAIGDAVGFPVDPLQLSASSLWRSWDTESEPNQSIVVGTLLYYEQCTGIILEDYKYIRWSQSGREELFHLGADPEEIHSVLDDHSDIVAHAQQEILHHIVEATALRDRLGLGPPQTDTLDPETAEGLRALGYIQ